MHTEFSLKVRLVLYLQEVERFDLLYHVVLCLLDGPLGPSVFIVQV